ncbi:hypothetical protein MHY13_03620 [Corynebacterium sp. ACRPE]|uniref:hypothetical protein n=1 Tax=Corynebacterium sp. ACRPE TaxID=2918196 RepID=UPI001EF57FE0|nr:hypothetical protein [Corynebacterium sp. ACRPE]MCG7467223.1 hypothetical protein [Corynebacterium sp. ACRPE]
MTTKTTQPQRFLEITSIATGEVAESFNVTGDTERQVERLLRGILTNLNREEFFVADNTREPEAS